MNYLSWKEETIETDSPTLISQKYAEGFVFTRKGKGVMQQTRSIRINLSHFELSSENKRILKKTDTINLKPVSLPLDSYDFSLGKVAKDFYETKFGPGIMSAQKIKEMLTDVSKSNFNTLLTYSSLGNTICYENSDILHYSYPFYDLKDSPKDMGMGMMVRAIEYAKQAGMKYIYLGSLQRPSDTYKLQFSGIEWFDGKEWSTDIEKVKEILATPQ